MKAIAELPKLLGKAGAEVDKFTMDIGLTYVHEIALLFQLGNGVPHYSKVELRQKSTTRRYLFREKEGNVKVPWSPTLRNSGKGATNLVEKLVNYCEDQPGFLGQVHIEFLKNQEIITREVQQLLDSTSQSKREKSFVTLVLSSGSGELYPGDIPEMRELFLKRVRRDTDEINANTALCSVCNTTKPVGAKVSDVFKFATFDKPGFAYRLDGNLSWVNLPVCNDCFADLAAGESILDENLRFFFFYGCNAWVIPKPLNPSRTAIEYFYNRFRRQERNKQLENYQVLELETLEEFKDEENWMELDFLFFRKHNSEVKIDLYVEDVLPSHLKAVLDTKEEVERQFQRYSTMKNGQNYAPRVMLDRLNDFLKTGRRKYFLEYVRSILNGNPISKGPLLNAVLESLATRLRERKRNPIRETVIEAFALLEFSARLGIIKEILEVEKLEAQRAIDEEVDQFFEEHRSFFIRPEDRAVVLLGVLTQRLLYLQYAQRQSQPFVKKLKNLNMTEQDFQNLLPEIRNKFQQYRSLNKTIANLFTITSRYFVEAGRQWKRDSGDLNFCFALGMGLSFESPFYNPGFRKPTYAKAK